MPAPDFLVINGFRVTVAEGSVTQEYTSKGSGLEVSPGDRLRDSRRAQRLRWTARAICGSNAEAMALSGLVHGYAHSITFDTGLESSTGVNPSADYAAHLDQTQGWQGAALVVRSGGICQWDFQLDDEWAVVYRHREPATGRWRCLGVTHDGRQVRDGVIGQYGIEFQARVTAAGVLGLFGLTLAGALSDVLYDAVLVLPYYVPNTVLTALTLNEDPLGIAPSCHARGSMIEAPLGWQCAGRSASGTLVQKGLGQPRRDAPPFSRDRNFANNDLDIDIELEQAAPPAIGLDLMPRASFYAPLDAGTVNTGTLVIKDVIGNVDGLLTAGGAHVLSQGPDGYTNAAVSQTLATASVNFGSPSGFSAAGVGGRFSGALWFKLPTLGTQRVLASKWNESLNLREWRLGITSANTLFFTVSNAAGTLSQTFTDATGTPIVANAWNHIAWSYDTTRASGRVVMYLNGVPLQGPGLTVTNVGAFTAMTSGGAPFKLLNQDGPAGLGAVGHVAHAQIWSNVALVASEARTAYLLTKRHGLARRA